MDKTSQELVVWLKVSVVWLKVSTTHAVLCVEKQVVNIGLEIYSRLPFFSSPSPYSDSRRKELLAQLLFQNAGGIHDSTGPRQDRSPLDGPGEDGRVARHPRQRRFARGEDVKNARDSNRNSDAFGLI